MKSKFAGFLMVSTLVMCGIFLVSVLLGGLGDGAVAGQAINKGKSFGGGKSIPSKTNGGIFSNKGSSSSTVTEVKVGQISEELSAGFAGIVKSDSPKMSYVLADDLLKSYEFTDLEIQNLEEGLDQVLDLNQDMNLLDIMGANDIMSMINAMSVNPMDFAVGVGSGTVTGMGYIDGRTGVVGTYATYSDGSSVYSYDSGNVYTYSQNSLGETVVTYDNPNTGVSDTTTYYEGGSSTTIHGDGAVTNSDVYEGGSTTTTTHTNGVVVTVNEESSINGQTTTTTEYPSGATNVVEEDNLDGDVTEKSYDADGNPIDINGGTGDAYDDPDTDEDTSGDGDSGEGGDSEDEALGVIFPGFEDDGTWSPGSGNQGPCYPNCGEWDPDDDSSEDEFISVEEFLEQFVQVDNQITTEELVMYSYINQNAANSWSLEVRVNR